jgi:antidote-toxin recognition MazE-like antitoxin
MGSKPTQRNGKTRKAKPLASRDKVRAHRARLRAQGMRPVTLWVPDMRAPKFATEARRQSTLANNSRYAAQDQTWVDAMSAGTLD